MTAARLTSKNGFIIPPAGGIIQVQYTQFTGTNTYPSVFIYAFSGVATGDAVETENGNSHD